MHELDEATRRALASHYGPSARARSRMLAQLRTELGPGPGGDGGASQDPPTGSGAGQGDRAPQVVETPRAADLVWTAKVLATTLGLTATGLLALKIAAGALAPLSSSPAAVELPALETSTNEGELTDQHEPAINEAGASDPRQETRIPASEPPLPARAHPRAAQTKRSRPRATQDALARPDAGDSLTPPATSDSLAAELALLDRAQRYATRGPARALAALDEHAERFPAGELAPEREVLRVEILCATGRSAQIEPSRLQEIGAGLRARLELSCLGESSSDKSGPTW